jgi:hypothetical protein
MVALRAAISGQEIVEVSEHDQLRGFVSCILGFNRCLAQVGGYLFSHGHTPFVEPRRLYSKIFLSQASIVTIAQR